MQCLLIKHKSHFKYVIQNNVRDDIETIVCIILSTFEIGIGIKLLIMYYKHL